MFIGMLFIYCAATVATTTTATAVEARLVFGNRLSIVVTVVVFVVGFVGFVVVVGGGGGGVAAEVQCADTIPLKR